jgi:hypothetical protein
VLGGWRRGSEETTRAVNVKRFKGPRLSTLVSACLREDGRQRHQTSRKKHGKEKLKLETYILERTRALFTGWSDEPCLGAARFEPVVSGAAPLRPTALPAAAFSPIRSGVTPRLLDGWGRTMASTGEKGHMNIWGFAAPDKQRVREVRTDAGAAAREPTREHPTTYSSMDLPNG